MVDRHIGEVGEQLLCRGRAASERQVRPLVDERGGRAAGDEVGLLENPCRRDIGGNATDAELANARRAWVTAVAKSRPRQVSLTSIESKCGLT